METKQLDAPQERLKELLCQESITGRQLAKMLGVVPSAVSNVISGKRNLTRAFAHRISDVTGVNVEWLLSGKGEMMHVPTKATLTQIWTSMVEMKLAIDRLEANQEKYIKAITRLTDIIEEQEELIQKLRLEEQVEEDDCYIDKALNNGRRNLRQNRKARTTT